MPSGHSLTPSRHPPFRPDPSDRPISMMCSKTNYDSSSKRAIPRIRFSRKVKHLDMDDAKVALDIIIRPSLHLWKLALGRGIPIALKRPPKTVTLDDNITTRPTSPQKRVRFDEQPITISRRSFFERRRKNSGSSPARPCLVIRLSDDVCHQLPEPSFETDNRSVYEDCLPDHPAFLTDLHVLEGDESLDTRPLRCIRRSEFYETESGIATFDRTGYANYCLSRWLDKQREEARVPRKPVFEDPLFLPWPDRTLSPPSNEACPLPLLPSPICRSPRSLPRRIWRRFEDELQNAIVILIIGSFIHICLFLFLLYDILTRGFIPSDD